MRRLNALPLHLLAGIFTRLRVCMPVNQKSVSVSASVEMSLLSTMKTTIVRGLIILFTLVLWICWLSLFSILSLLRQVITLCYAVLLLSIPRDFIQFRKLLESSQVAERHIATHRNPGFIFSIFPWPVALNPSLPANHSFVQVYSPTLEL